MFITHVRHIYTYGVGVYITCCILTSVSNTHTHTLTHTYTHRHTHSHEHTIQVDSISIVGKREKLVFECMTVKAGSQYNDSAAYCHLSSVICHLSSVICHLSSTVMTVEWTRVTLYSTVMTVELTRVTLYSTVMTVYYWRCIVTVDDNTKQHRHNTKQNDALFVLFVVLWTGLSRKTSIAHLNSTVYLTIPLKIFFKKYFTPTHTIMSTVMILIYSTCYHSSYTNERPTCIEIIHFCMCPLASPYPCNEMCMKIL